MLITMTKEQHRKYNREWARKKRARVRNDAEWKRKQCEYQKRCRARYPDRYKARAKVFIEKRAGRMTTKNCWCGEPGEAHHPSYENPTEVEWLCPIHHRERDRERDDYRVSK